jgi:hypothetical protein
MFPGFIVGVLIGGIIGWAISSWRHARIDVPPPSIGCLGLTNGKNGIWLDPYYARLLKPILKDLNREML